MAELVTEAPVHFTLHFIESMDNADVGYTGPYTVEVVVAGTPRGKLTFHEGEWDSIWRALVGATPSFDRRGIALRRTGRFR